MRFVYLLAGVTFVALGVVGAVLPLLPSTVFFILAAACFARSSPRIEAWLLSFPPVGEAVRAWRERGAIPKRAKWLAVTGMTAGAILLVALHPGMIILGVAAAVLAGSAAFVLTRPD